LLLEDENCPDPDGPQYEHAPSPGGDDDEDGVVQVHSANSSRMEKANLGDVSLSPIHLASVFTFFRFFRISWPQADLNESIW
jgi:hypothetical protein